MARCGCSCHHGSAVPAFNESPDVTDWYAALTACASCVAHHAPAGLVYVPTPARRRVLPPPPPPPPPLPFTNDDTLDNGG